MNKEKPSFPPSRAYINHYLARCVATGQDDLEKLELIQRGVFDLWSSLINDPADPPTIPLELEGDPGITGVAVSVSGNLIPRGRWAKTNIKKDRFKDFLSDPGLRDDEVDIDEKSWAALVAGTIWGHFADALLFAYWRIYGRDVAVAHHFLHELDGTPRTLHMDFNAADDSRSDREPPGNNGEKVGHISLGRFIDHFAFENAEDKKRLSRFFGQLLIRVNRIGKVAPSTEDYIEIAEEVVVGAENHCFRNTLQKANGELLFLVTSDAKFRNDLYKLMVDKHGWVDDEKGIHKQRENLERAIKSLQLLMLYKNMAENHFYIMTPGTNDKQSQYAFTAWRRNDIGDDLKDLWRFANDLSAAANGLMTQDVRPSFVTPINSELQIFYRILGHDLTATFKEERWDKFHGRMSDQYNVKFHAFAGYLHMAEALVQVAVHERQKLRFRIHVSGGKAASKRVQYVSAVNDNRKHLLWVVKKRHESSLDDKCVDEPSIISRLLGNYSFFQDDRHVIQASPWGHIQYLGSLIGSTKPEEITKEGDNVLIVIEPNSDIQVFFAAEPSSGKLQLWRRGGKWIMPHSYGADYIANLAKGIEDLTGLKDEKKDEEKIASVRKLCECAWELSTIEQKGACFVILNGFTEEGEEGKHAWEHYFSPMTKVLPFAEKRRLLTEAGKTILKRLAVQDGVTVVDLDTGQVSGRRHILVNYDVANWLSNRLTAENELMGWWEKGGVHRLLRWGTRHHSALAVALFLNDRCGPGKAAVVTVSSDGDIHLLGRDGPKLELSYPYPS